MAGYRTLRKQLDDLGYYQPLVVDAVPLVEALLHDLLTTTNSLKLCKEAKDTKKNYNTNETENNELKNVSKPKASSTPILSSTPEETNAKIISLKSRTKDLENLNKECNSIIRRQQIELDAKSTKILKLELSSGNSRAKVVTHHDRPLIISDSLKPRIEMTRLISTKEHSKESRKPILECNEDDVPHSQIDVVKIYEKRNQHLDRELAKLQTELDTARKLLSQAEKQWYWNTSNGKENVPSNIQKNSNEIQQSNTPECHKSNYMIKVYNHKTIIQNTQK
jgi:centrosomal protein CEP135